MGKRTSSRFNDDKDEDEVEVEEGELRGYQQSAYYPRSDCEWFSCLLIEVSTRQRILCNYLVNEH